MTAVAPAASWRSARGSALVEVAISLPLMVVIVLGATDFARVSYTAIELTNEYRGGYWEDRGFNWFSGI